MTHKINENERYLLQKFNDSQSTFQKKIVLSESQMTLQFEDIYFFRYTYDESIDSLIVN